MHLHIFIAGKRAYSRDIEPGMVREALDMIEGGIDTLAQYGRVTVALDSEAHGNVTYILNRRAT